MLMIKFAKISVWAIPTLTITALLAFSSLASSKSRSTPAKLEINSISSPLKELSQQLVIETIIGARIAIAPSPSTIAKPQSQKIAKAPSTAAKIKSQKKAKAKIAAYKPPSVQIRVAISQKTPVLAIGTSTPARLKTLNGQRIGFLPRMEGVNVQIQPQGLQIGERIFPGVVWVEPTTGGAIYVGDRWYRGRLLLVAQPEGILAVNAVELENYLYSVVGSEMHANAPLEALKAQSVAARSYALVHILRPASNWYNLGNTQRWQVYKGIRSEFPATYQAVNETGGQILSDRGRVVESLYASTAEIVKKVHKGWGMSQTGAYQLANQGYTYQQILQNYYPGVQLSRLGAR
jgi:peptidoglycan hydrolase-like amidase